ncbi:MAG: hypothetical protein SF123_22395 [Chloroflexota bacterium]|nr:hypothetical protein [Chloroflexota bacterium]
MRRLIILLPVLCILAVTSLALAQETSRPQPGDAPRADRISISVDAAGFATITGADNAVFATAQLAIRNLYTQETVYTQSTIRGSFSATLFGPGNTPFMISPVQGVIPDSQRNVPGALPGGPAVIVTGGAPLPDGDGAQFTISGALGNGDERWTANGTLNQLVYEPETLTPLSLTLDVAMPNLADRSVDPNTLRFIGLLELQPVAVRAGEGTRAVGGQHSNNGWSGVLTPGSLAIDDIGAPIPLAEVAVGEGEVAQVVDGLAFIMRFEQRLPTTLLPGLYVPVLRGFVRVGDDTPQPWETSALFGTGDGLGRATQTRLPLVINVGEVESVELPWALLVEAPSNGTRGLLPADTAAYALSNRVIFNAPTYILPPNSADGETPLTYSLEPHLLMQLPNAYDMTTAPLIPLALPGGRLSVRVTAPDGTTFSQAAQPFAQARLGTATNNERARYGAQSPLDTYQLTTLNPALSAHSFTQYGEHIIEVEGELEDVFGNRYTGGGEYRVLIAELFDLTPGVLSGTPFAVGDRFNPGLHIAPAAAADVSVRVRIFPLDGGAPIERTFEGVSNMAGHFEPDAVFTFDVPGEYVIDYEARFTDLDGRLWAGSLRSAGVIAGDSGMVAHGARGLYTPEAPRQAQYHVERLLERAGVNGADVVVLNAPYQSGDVLWLPDGANSGIAPVVRVQDLLGSYSDWLLAGVATDGGELGVRIRDGAVIDELPAVLLTDETRPFNPADNAPPTNAAYSYISMVTPALSARQFVSGSVLPVLPTWMDMDDPLNGQIGAGAAGLLPGDVLFLFGGAIVRNDALNLSSSSIYGSVAIVTDDSEPGQVATAGRGADGAEDAGPLITVDDVSYDAFFVPTGVQPGQVLAVGERLDISGQVAPALPASVSVRIIAPDGTATAHNGRANTIGYFYDPTQSVVVDQVGIWAIEIRVTQDAPTSAGVSVPPFPQGGILGTPDGIIYIYVVEDLAQRLESPIRPDLVIPSALPFNFNLTIPQGWSLPTVTYTLATPGLVLEQGTLRPSGRAINYQYNPSNINNRFPNIELDGVTDGSAGSDSRQLTLFVQALDELGNPQVLYRVYTIFHDRLISLD